MSLGDAESQQSGDLLQDYEILRELGRGGMGVVYLARHRLVGHEVVIKTLVAEALTPTSRERFQREGAALALLQHPQIVRIRGFGVSAGAPYLIMDYIPGASLRELVGESDSAEVAWVCQILAPVARALACCHEKGIVHRDVKPDNVVVRSEDGAGVLVDFGVAAVSPDRLRESIESLTSTGVMLGTPGFLPPEQLEVKGELGRIGPASDVWSFGATLYFALTAQSPFGKLSFSAWCASLVSSEPESARVLRPDLPRWLTELCSACLRRRQGDRPNMEVVAAALESRSFRRAWVGRGAALGFGLLGVGAVAIIIALSFFERDREAPRIVLGSSTLQVKTSGPVELRGKVLDEAPAWVEISGAGARRRVTTEADGSFRARLIIGAGRHALTLIAGDVSGNRSAPSVLTVRVDTQPPLLRLKPVLVEAEGLLLEGSVDEESVVRVNGELVSLVKAEAKFEFRARISFESLRSDLSVEAVDMLGNRAVWSSPRFLVVGPRCRYRSLRGAIAAAPEGATVALCPGRYRGNVELRDRSLNLLGLGARSEVQIKGRDYVFRVHGQRLTLRNLKLETGTAAGALIEVNEAEARLDDCLVIARGAFGIVLRGSAKKRARLVLRRTELKRSQGAAIKASRADLLLENCQFLGSARALLAGVAGAMLREAATVQLASGSVGRFLHCEFLHSLDRALSLRNSRGEMRECKIFDARFSGLSVGNSRLLMDRCALGRCGVFGIGSLGKSRLRILSSVIEANGCRSRNKVWQVGLYLRPGGVAELHETTIRGHFNAALSIARGALAKVEGCKLKDNRKGVYAGAGRLENIVGDKHD